MKRKISIPIFTILFLMLFSISVFANGWGGDDNNTKSEAGIKVWDEFYPAKRNINGQTLYLYDMQEKNMNNAVMNLYLGEFFSGSRPFFRGQFAYLPIDNNGSPSDLSPLMNASNFAKLYSIHGNNANNVGGSYVSVTGRVYPTVYPSGHPLAGQKNWNFKTSTRTKNVYDNPPNTDMHFFRHTTGITGNVRFVYDLKGIQMGFYAFSPDAISGDEGFQIDKKNVLKDPWNQMSSAVQQGQFNKDWETNKNTLKPSFDTDGNRKMIERLNVLSMEQYRPDFKAKLAELTKRTYKDVDISDDYKNVWYRVDTMYKYFSVHNRGGHGYGNFMLVHQGSSKKWYYSFSSPRLYISKDLAFGGAKFNSGKIEYFPLAGDEKYDFKIYDAETGEAIPEEGTMIVGKKYVARFFVGFQKIGHDVLQSYHSNIKTYIDIDLFTKGQTISPNKTFSEKALEGFMIGRKGWMGYTR